MTVLRRRSAHVRELSSPETYRGHRIELFCAGTGPDARYCVEVDGVLLRHGDQPRSYTTAAGANAAGRRRVREGAAHPPPQPHGACAHLSAVCVCAAWGVHWCPDCGALQDPVTDEFWRAPRGAR